MMWKVCWQQAHLLLQGQNWEPFWDMWAHVAHCHGKLTLMALMSRLHICGWIYDWSRLTLRLSAALQVVGTKPDRGWPAGMLHIDCAVLYNTWWHGKPFCDTTYGNSLASERKPSMHFGIFFVCQSLKPSYFIDHHTFSKANYFARVSKHKKAPTLFVERSQRLQTLPNFVCFCLLYSILQPNSSWQCNAQRSVYCR